MPMMENLFPVPFVTKLPPDTEMKSTADVKAARMAITKEKPSFVAEVSVHHQSLCFSTHSRHFCRLHNN